jgi:hypothetical protein
MGGALSKNAAGYYPMIQFDDPEKPGTIRKMGPSCMIAGMTAKIDSTAGRWTAAAGTKTRFSVGEPSYLLSDLEQEPLNRLVANPLERECVHARAAPRRRVSKFKSL